MRLILILLITHLTLLASPQIIAKGESEGMKYQVKVVAQNLGGIPWGMVFVSDDELFVNLITGEMFLYHLKDKRRTPVARMSQGVLYSGQGGLMDVALDPDFHKNKLLYFTYVKNINHQGATTLARARLEGNLLKEWQDLLITHSATATSRHFGSRITFDDDGYFYFGVGDRGERPSAQDLSTHNGTIMRLLKDGGIPQDNPFISNSKAMNEIYSYGHRNPQGLVYDSNRKILWEIEHGPRGGDELNRIEKGKNYGWPIIGYGKEYWGPIHVGEGTQKDGME
jgi:glucose/arabinose dehydrogenase